MDEITPAYIEELEANLDRIIETGKFLPPPGGDGDEHDDDDGTLDGPGKTDGDDF